LALLVVSAIAVQGQGAFAGVFELVVLLQTA
jgi:hypothetical protein